MDIETAEAIERVEGSFKAEIGNLRAEIRAEIGSFRTEVRTEFGNVRTEMATMRDELMRHTDMRFESLRDDIRIVAEDFAALSAKIDAR